MTGLELNLAISLLIPLVLAKPQETCEFFPISMKHEPTNEVMAVNCLLYGFQTSCIFQFRRMYGEKMDLLDTFNMGDFVI